jgi:NNP family nitrate/nitrite transporter-like MFS transporter
MRFPLGLLAQYVGRKTATLVELGLITLTMAFGYFFVHSYDDLLKMALLLGVAGASFGVAMSLGSGWYPPKYKGLAMGLVGAGNVGTAVAALLAPPLALKFGWQSVYGIAAIASFVPMLVVAFMAKEPPDRDEHAKMKEHLACLWEKDGWVFSLIYIVTFRRLHRPHHLPAHLLLRPVRREQGAGGAADHAGRADGRGMRVVGGWISDHWGGINTLTGVLVVVIALACWHRPVGSHRAGADHAAA